MSVMIVLAERRQFRGIYSQRKILWGILENLEGNESSALLNPLESLVIESKNGKIESDTGSGKRYVKCTYGNLCGCMRDSNKVALHRSDTFEPVYAIWQTEPNVLFKEDENEDVQCGDSPTGSGSGV